MYACPIHECAAFIILTLSVVMRVTRSDVAYNEANDPTTQSIRLRVITIAGNTRVAVSSIEGQRRDVSVNNYVAFATNRYYTRGTKKCAYRIPTIIDSFHIHV